ncbi:MAG: hypothetical protein Tsb0010_06610 [Parvularculaceae bacterium]
MSFGAHRGFEAAWGAVAAFIVSAGAAAAAPTPGVHVVSSTSVINCVGATVGPAPHGLWTNSLVADPPNECGNYFNIDAGTTLEIFGDGTGILQGTATNPQGLLATFLVNLADFAEVSDYKQEGGGVYDGTTDSPDIDFFRDVSGTIEIDGETYVIEGVPSPYAFQYGPGANAKDPSAFGASTWLNIAGQNGHWDFNLNLERQEVPLPASLYLFVFGLTALGASSLRRRRRAIAR